jgi:hypothetical protein
MNPVKYGMTRQKISALAGVFLYENIDKKKLAEYTMRTDARASEKIRMIQTHIEIKKILQRLENEHGPKIPTAVIFSELLNLGLTPSNAIKKGIRPIAEIKVTNLNGKKFVIIDKLLNFLDIVQQKDAIQYASTFLAVMKNAQKRF